MTDGESEHVPDEYDDYTVDDVRDHVGDIDDPDELDALLAYEQANKDRDTAADAIESRRSAIDADEDESAEDGAQAVDEEDGDVDPEDIDLVAGDYDEDEHEFEGNDGSRRVRVRNYKKQGITVDGIGSFAAGEVKDIVVDDRVRRAIRAGELQVVSG